jgi:hypothetical protein
MKEPKMELFQQTFQLALGIHQAPMVCTVRLRTLVPSENVDKLLEMPPNMDIYGNVSHIERANPSAQNSEDELAAAVEPGKTVERNGGDLSPEIKLNTNNYPSLNQSSPSLGGSSSTSVFRQQHNFLNRMRGTKHSKKRRHEATAGQIQLGIRYDDVRFKLLVDVVCAKELISVEKNGEADPYVSVKLVPVNGNANKAKKGKTAVVKGSLNPYFDNQLEFDVHSTDLANYKLQFVVKDAINYGVITKAPLLGTVDIPLQNFTKETAIANEWFALNPPNR